MQLGAFTILARLGRGAMGTVHLAERDGRRYAVKVLHPHLAGDELVRARFQREATSGARVKHPNVVRTYEAGDVELDGEPSAWIAMELVEGRTLRERLRAGGVYAPEDARALGVALALGLDAIHAEGIVHRDVKPDNIIVLADGPPKLMDLGVAAVHDETVRLSRTGQFLGSVRYAAPEQLEGKPGDPRMDLYALGLVLYEVLTGAHPFEGAGLHALVRQQSLDAPPPLRESVPSVPADLAAIVATLLQKDPEHRFTSARQVADALRDAEGSTWWSRRRGVGGRRLATRLDAGLFVGREAERASLRALRDQVLSGQGRVLCLEGASGIGKSRFLEDTIARWVEAGTVMTVLRGGHPAGGAATRYGAFREALARYYRECGGETPAGDLATLPSLVGPMQAFLDDVPVATEVLLDAEAIRASLTALLRCISQRNPVVWVVDDLHRAPPEGRQAFASLAHAAAGLPVLLVGVLEEGTEHGWVQALAAAPHIQRVALAGLETEDVAALLADDLGSERLGRELAPLTWRRTRGSPTYVRAWIRSLRADGHIIRGSDGRPLLGTRLEALEDVPVPDSVRASAALALQAVDADLRDLLLAAACAGERFDPTLVAEALEQRPLAVLRVLERGTEGGQGLVVAEARAYRFARPETREYLLASASALVKEALHAALAAAIEGRCGEPPDGESRVRLCEHWIAARRVDRALIHLDGAVAHLEAHAEIGRAGQLEAAVLEDDVALCGAARLAVLMRRARRSVEDGPHAGLGDDPSVWIAELTSAAQGFGQAGDRVAASRLAALAALKANDLAMATTHLAAMQPSDRAAASASEQAQVLAVEAKLHWARSEAAAAMDAMRASLAMLPEDAPPALAWRLHVDFSLLARSGGFNQEVLAPQERSLEIARRHKLGLCEAESRVALAWIHYAAGRADAARDEVETAIEVAREHGQRTLCATWCRALGEIEFSAGRYPASLARHAEGLDIAEELGDALLVAEARLRLAKLLSRTGRGEEARHYLADMTLPQAPSPALEASWLYEEAHVAWACGDWEAAQTLFLRTRTCMADAGLMGIYTRAATELKLGIGALLAGDDAEARARLDEAHELWGGGSAGEVESAARARAWLGVLDGAPAGSSPAGDEAPLVHDPHRRLEMWHAFTLRGETKQVESAARQDLALVLQSMAPAWRAALLASRPHGAAVFDAAQADVPASD